MTIRYLAYVRFPTEKAHGLQIMKTCEAFARLGHEVELVIPTRINSLQKEDPFAYYSVERNFTITKITSPDFIHLGPVGYMASRKLFTGAVKKYLASRPADCVFSRDEQVLAHLTHSALVWESHTGAWNSAAQKVARSARTIVVLTHGAESFYRAHGVASEKLVVAPDGIDLADFTQPETKEAARTRLGLPQEKKIALYIGRLDGWKGTKALFEAAGLLPKNILVAVMGGEPAQIEASHSTYPEVQFLGFHPYRELANNQAAADVLVLPNTAKDEVSVTFTSPLKLFTYMGSDRPIVASDLPSIREVLDESCAYLVAPDDSQALATTIQTALADLDAPQRAAKAREKVAQYSWEARARAILSALKI